MNVWEQIAPYWRSVPNAELYRNRLKYTLDSKNASGAIRLWTARKPAAPALDRWYDGTEGGGMSTVGWGRRSKGRRSP